MQAQRSTDGAGYWARGCRVLATVLLWVFVSVAQAQSTWNLLATIKPDGLPEVNPSDTMGFGHAVAMSSGSWLLVGAPMADCTTSTGIVADAGRIFFFKRNANVWQFYQSFCADIPVTYGRYGNAVDVAGTRAIVGAPGASIDMIGVVEHFLFDRGTNAWMRVSTVTGTLGGALGMDVAVDGSLAIAGEPYANNQKGRVRSWKIGPTSVIPEPDFAPAGLEEYDQYGVRLSLFSHGCEVTSCTRPPDSMAVLGGEHVYLAHRSAGNWIDGQTLTAPTGATFDTYANDVAIGATLMAVSMSVTTPSAAIACQAGPAVRVYKRSVGVTYVAIGEVCPMAGDTTGLMGVALDVGRTDATFHVGSPDSQAFSIAPIAFPASVSSFEVLGSITHLDTQFELSLAPVGPGPNIFNDAYGWSVSGGTDYMGVGAPWRHIYIGSLGVGYVAVYQH